jgi:hypothetical protein
MLVEDEEDEVEDEDDDLLGWTDVLQEYEYE